MHIIKFIDKYAATAIGIVPIANAGIVLSIGDE